MAATQVSEGYLKELVEDRKKVYGSLFKQIEDNRDLRYRRNEINVPEVYKATTQEVRVPIVADMLFRVTATLSTDKPTVSVPPYAATEEAKRNASLRERWSQAALDEMMRTAGRNTLRMRVDAAVGDSVGIFKLVERKEVWKGFPKRGQTEDGGEEDAKAYLKRTDKFTMGKPFPFVWDDLDPLTVMRLPLGLGKYEVVEVTKRPLLPTMRQFNVYRNGDGEWQKLRIGEPMPEGQSSGGGDTELVEHWPADGSVVTYMLDGKILEHRTVNYGRPPHFVMGGHMTSSRKPEEMYQSVIQPFAHLVPALESMLTMLTNWGFFAAYPFLVDEDPTRANATGPANPVIVTEIKPGTILHGYHFLEPPQTSKAIADLVTLFQQMIDRSGLAAVMYGQGASSSSGYMVSQLMTAAQLVYAPIVDNFRMGLEQMIPFMWQLIERRLKRRVFVWGGASGKSPADWLGLGPDDIDGYYACEVAMKPILPMDKIAQGDFAKRMIEADIWSKEHGRTETGVEQPEEEADQIAVEKYMESPRINELIIEDAAKKAGLIKPEPAPTPTQGLVDQYGQPMQPGGGGDNAGGFGPTPPIEPTGPLSPGQGLPMVPSQPNMPQGVQRRPGGNFGPPVGPI